MKKSLIIINKKTFAFENSLLQRFLMLNKIIFVLFGIHRNILNAITLINILMYIEQSIHNNITDLRRIP